MRTKLAFALLLVLVALAAGCGTSTTTPSFDAATVAQFDANLAIVKSDVSAEGMVVMLSVPGRGDYLGISGTDEITTGSPMDPRKLCRIGSCTKTFVATVALQLVDEGLISLDDKVSTYLTGVPSGDSVTLRMLFNHTSGLPIYTDSTAFGTAVMADRFRQFTHQELLDYAWAMPMKFAPGTSFKYCNTNLVLLGLIIEKVNKEGDTLEQAIKRRIIDKLGLTNTSFPTGESFPGVYLHGYQRNMTTGTSEDWSLWNPSWAWAAGAMISNLYDLQTYIKAICTNSAGLLSPALQAKRLNDDWVSTGGLATGKYGLGWMQVGGFIYHDGLCFGYHTIAAYDPASGATFVGMMNTKPSGDALVDLMVSYIKILFPDRAI